MSERPPVNQALTVIESIDIYKTQKWWKAVVITEGKDFRRAKQVEVYQWLNQNGKWKRKQKMGVKNADEWAKIKEAVEQLLQKL